MALSDDAAADDGGACDCGGGKGMSSSSSSLSRSCCCASASIRAERGSKVTCINCVYVLCECKCVSEMSGNMPVLLLSLYVCVCTHLLPPWLRVGRHGQLPHPQCHAVKKCACVYLCVYMRCLGKEDEEEKPW